MDYTVNKGLLRTTESLFSPLLLHSPIKFCILFQVKYYNKNIPFLNVS